LQFFFWPPPNDISGFFANILHRSPAMTSAFKQGQQVSQNDRQTLQQAFEGDISAWPPSPSQKSFQVELQ